MSQTGLYAGVYDHLRGYAELVDKVLIQMKTGSASPDEDKLKSLRAFLELISGTSAEDVSGRLIRMLLADESEINLADYGRIGRLLTSGEFDSSIIEPLEKLAMALEHEQAGVMARMRE